MFIKLRSPVEDERTPVSGGFMFNPKAGAGSLTGVTSSNNVFWTEDGLDTTAENLAIVTFSISPTLSSAALSCTKC